MIKGEGDTSLFLNKKILERQEIHYRKDVLQQS